MAQNQMREPINLHGLECVVRYPSSIYSLERHENLPHERFCYNAFRIGIEALNLKGLPEQIHIEFPPSSDRMPAWAINANIRPQRRADGTLMGFTIAFPELMPTLVMSFAHIVSKELDNNFGETPQEEILELARKWIQKFVDVASVGVREYRSSGLASSIRAIYESGGITLPTVQNSFDYFDSISQFIGNHEIAHAYVGQLHAVRASSTEESKAFEFIADLLGTKWLFNHFIWNTPDTEEYRKAREHTSFAESLEANVYWLIQTQQSVAILMALATAQATGKVSLSAGAKHPTGFGRYNFQMLWLISLTSGYLGEKLGEQALNRIQQYNSQAGTLIAGSVTTRSNLKEMWGDAELAAMQKGAELIESLKIVELEHAVEFIRYFVSKADKAREVIKTTS